ncbi:MAG: hypothetical protein LQ346_007131, partial [Caloplaca aetnensis]
MRNQLKKALLAAGLANGPLGVLAEAQAPPEAEGTVSTVSSTYGVYTLAGCYAAPSSGYLLDGKTTVSAGLTLASCASFCAGSPAFAVQNGKQCLCGSQAPIASPLGAEDCTTKCSGNASEDCGSNSSAIVYTSSPRGGQVSVTTYPTTLPNGVVSTVTSSSTLPPSSSASVAATTYTTTDAQGSPTVVTSSTTVAPAPAGSTSATTFVTTDAAGSSFTTTRATVVPPPVSSNRPATSVIVQSSTNAQGSVIVTSSTSTAAGPFSSSACGGTYSNSLEDLYHVDCSLDYPGYDLSTLQVADFESCVEACDNYVPSAANAGGAGCVGVTAGYRTAGVECYLKYNIIETRSAVGSDSAYKLDSNVHPQAPSASWGLPSNPATTNLPVGQSSSVVNVPSPRPTASTSAANVNPTAAAQPCPLSDGQPFVDQQGTVFDIQCEVQYPGFDLTTPHFDTFQECILACDNYVPDPAVAGGADCVAVTWGFGNVGGNCYLKYNVGEVRAGSPNDASARLRNGASLPIPLPNPASSSLINLPLPTTSLNLPLPTSNIDLPLPTTSLNLPLPTSNINLPLPTTSLNLPLPTTIPTDQLTASLPCPASDGLPFIDSQGTVFDIACQVQYPGFDLATPHFDTFQECILACDNYVPNPAIAGGQGCVAVTWGFGNVGGNCYLKYNVGEVRAGSINDASAKLSTIALPNPGTIVSNLPLPTTSILSVPLPDPGTIIPPLPITSILSGLPTINLPLPATTNLNVPLPATTILNVPLPGTTNLNVPLPGTVVQPGTTGVSSSAPPGPSQISGSATCPDQNSAIYTNQFGNQYELFCGVEINGDNALQAAHADTFEDCVAFCDLLPGCTAITYPGDVGLDNAFRSNCYPYTSFNAFTVPNVPTLRSARPIGNSSNTGTRFNSDILCPAYNGQPYTDPANGKHQVACGTSYPSTGDLYATVLPTLEACVTYC